MTVQYHHHQYPYHHHYPQYHSDGAFWDAKCNLETGSERTKKVSSDLQKGFPSIPTSLSDELNTNIFLRCDDNKIKNKLKMDNASKFEVFTKLRNLKDKF